MKHASSRAPDLLHGPVFSNMTRFFLPIMLGSLLQQLYSMVDAVVLGRLVGKTALAAVGGSDLAIINLVVGFFVGLASGACVVVSQHYGAGEDGAVRRAVHTAILFSVVIGAVMTALGIGLARPILVLLDPPADTLEDSIVYLQWYFAGMIPSMVYNMGAGILRAVGDSKRPLYFLIVCALANTALDLLFVAGFRLGTAGAAIATSLSQLICAGLVVWTLARIPGACRLQLSELRFDRALLGRMTAIGLPAGIQSSVFSLSNVVIQSSVNSFGSIVIAGNAAAANVGNFVYQAMNTFQQAVTCFAGQNMGARKPARVIRALYVCLIWALVFGLVFGLASCIFGTQLLSLYTTDPQVIAVGLERLYIVCGPYFLCGVMDVMTGVLRGIGYSLLPMVVSLLGACAFRILWVVTIFAAVPTMNCLMISYPVSWALTFAVLVVFFALLWRRIQAHYTPEEIARR